jgi:hypothetical protein
MSRPCQACQDHALIPEIYRWRFLNLQLSVFVSGHPAINCHSACVLHPVPLFVSAIACLWLVRGAPAVTMRVESWCSYAKTFLPSLHEVSPELKNGWNS